MFCLTGEMKWTGRVKTSQHQHLPLKFVQRTCTVYIPDTTHFNTTCKYSILMTYVLLLSVCMLCLALCGIHDLLYFPCAWVETFAVKSLGIYLGKCKNVHNTGVNISLLCVTHCSFYSYENLYFGNKIKCTKNWHSFRLSIMKNTTKTQRGLWTAAAHITAINRILLK